jgi:hypothetical protein
MHTTYSKSSTYRGVTRTRKAGEAVLSESLECGGAAQWVRIRAKALWLAYRVWRVTRKLRAVKLRIAADRERLARGRGL